MTSKHHESDTGPSRGTHALLVAAFTLLAAACAERDFQVKDTIQPNAGGAAGGTGKADAGSARDARRPIDAVVRRDACVASGQPEICNDLDDDCDGKVDNVVPEVLTRIESCGSCNVVCVDVPNATPICADAKCAYTCVDGAIDIDKSKTNGCECILIGAAHDTNGTVPETACDGRDNDCDGMVDEAFDLMGSLTHCGGCNTPCSFPFAAASCALGVCKIGACQTGFFDRDQDPKNGCESPCQQTNAGAEICDGVDNDCDGTIDDATEIAGQKPACKSMGVCAGTQATCAGSQGWTCQYPATFEEVESKAKGCDGLDNDCDGLPDEPYLVGTPCSTPPTVKGECAATGMLRCKSDKSDVECSAAAGQPQPEICDGLNNDCDDETDELARESNKTADDQLFYLPGVNATMFIHEATRVDATAANPGRENGGRPCSVPNRQPWSNVTKEQAAAACKSVGAGWRLCTRNEWLDACQGVGGRTFPYGSNFDAQICNGAEYVKNAGVTTIPTGTAKNNAGTNCTSDTGVWDLSGNVKEWVNAGTATPDPTNFEIRGGAYNIAGLNNGDGMACTSAVPAPTVPVQLPSVGFRCCLTGRLPQ